MVSIIINAIDAIAALVGIVINQAYTIFFPTPHLTAESLLVEPTPMIAPEIAWVVLTGMPSPAIAVRITPPPVSAQKP